MFIYKKETNFSNIQVIKINFVVLCWLKTCNLELENSYKNNQ